MTSYEHTLPVEQWRQVLTHVSPSDLCNVVLVSRHMNSVASLQELWARMKVSRRKVRKNGVAEFYGINRFKKVKQINFEKWKLECEELERLLNEIPGSPLENANLSFNKFSGVSAELLASAASHLRIVNLSTTRLTTDQCVALLEASLSSATLNTVDLTDVNIKKVPSELLANSIGRLKDVNLGGTRLTTDQCVALLKASLCSTTLTNLSLRKNNLSKVPPELLANSVSGLKDVNLSSTSLTTEQSVALLKASLSSRTLTYLSLRNVNLSAVPVELLVNSVSVLQYVNLSSTRLTTDQYLALP